MARIDEIVDGIYRISTTFDLDGFDFQFNQFLIDDERPALVHTGITRCTTTSAARSQSWWTPEGSST
jgi:hypothetical protein